MNKSLISKLSNLPPMRLLKSFLADRVRAKEQDQLLSAKAVKDAVSMSRAGVFEFQAHLRTDVSGIADVLKQFTIRVENGQLTAINKNQNDALSLPLVQSAKLNDKGEVVISIDGNDHTLETDKTFLRDVKIASSRSPEDLRSYVLSLADQRLPVTRLESRLKEITSGMTFDSVDTGTQVSQEVVHGVQAILNVDRNLKNVDFITKNLEAHLYHRANLQRQLGFAGEDTFMFVEKTNIKHLVQMSAPGTLMQHAPAYYPSGNDIADLKRDFGMVKKLQQTFAQNLNESELGYGSARRLAFRAAHEIKLSNPGSIHHTEAVAYTENAFVQYCDTRREALSSLGDGPNPMLEMELQNHLLAKIDQYTNLQQRLGAPAY